MNRILRADWLAVISSLWRKVPSAYKYSFIVFFIALNVVYLYHTVNFLWGNHDWFYINSQIRLQMDFNYGRFSAHVLKRLFSYGYILPIVNNVIAFAGLALSAVMLNIYWKLPKKLSVYLVTGLVFILQPYLIEWLYFPRSLPDLFFGGAFIIIALSILERVYLKTLPLAFIILAVFLITFALGIYPSLISSVAIIFIGRILVELLQWDGTKAEFLAQLKKFCFIFIFIFISAILFFITTKLLKHLGYSMDYYTISSISLAQIPAKLLLVIKQTFGKLFAHYPVPFFPKAFSYMFLVVLILALITIIVQNRCKLAKIGLLLLFLWFGLFFSHTAAFLAEFKDSMYLPRVDFCGFAYFHALLIVIIFISKPQLTKNITLILCILILQISVVQDIQAQKIWKMGLENEKMLWNRLLTKLEMQEQFNPTQKYTVVEVGLFPATRPKYYNKPVNKFVNPYAALTASYEAEWVVFGPQLFYYYANFMKKGFNTMDTMHKPELQEILKNNKDVILNAKIWPAANSVYVKDDVIFVFASKKELEKIQKYVMQAAE